MSIFLSSVVRSISREVFLPSLRRVSFGSFVFVALFLGAIATPSPAGAQTASSSSEDAPSLVSSPEEPLPNTVGCFDYYRFGSVQADVEGMVSSVASGVPMHFRGTIQNGNDYPVVEGAVYAKVFRKQSDDSLTHQNGHNLVDQFFVNEDISLPARGSLPIEFDWQVPASAVSGDYRIDFFFTAAKKFNLLGLSFTDDVVGNGFDFTVTGRQKSFVAFDKNTVTVGGQPYRFAAFPPRNDRDQDIPVTAQLVNPTATAQTAQISWKLYSWDAQSEDNLLDTRTETVTLQPGETATVAYTDTNRTGSVHLLVAESRVRDTKSLLDIRYGREGVDQPRINFPAVTSYPLSAGQEITLFSCLHNAGVATVPGNTLDLTLKDDRGKVIHAYRYEGGITGAMMAVKDTFVPDKTYRTFSLEAVLTSGGAVVDQATMRYDCESLGNSDCADTPTVPFLGSGISGTFRSAFSWFGIATLVILLGLFVHARRRRKKGGMSGMRAAILFLPLSLALLNAPEAEAKSTVWNTAYDGTRLFYHYYRDVNREDIPDNVWIGGLTNISVSVTRNAYANYPDGATVPVGTTLQFTAPVKDTDISWFGMGLAFDSPYGHWIGDAVAPKFACDAMDAVGEAANSNDIYVYVPLSIHPSTIAFAHEGSTAGLACNDTGSTCTITSPGTVKTKVTYSDTYGKFYYRYKQNNLGRDCSGNNEPMAEVTSLRYSRVEPEIKTFIVDVPVQQVDFTFTAEASGLPSPPMVTADPPARPLDPATGTADFLITASGSVDPQDGTIKYAFYFGDENGAFDPRCSYPAGQMSCAQFISTGTVPSGGTQSMMKKEGAVGQYRAWAFAINGSGALSPWSQPATYAVTDGGVLQVCSSCAAGATLYSLANPIVLDTGQSKDVVACYSAALPPFPCAGANVSGQAVWSSDDLGVATLTRNPSDATVRGGRQGNTTGTATYTPPARRSGPASASFGIRVNDSAAPPPPPSSCACDPNENAKRCKGSYAWTCSNGMSTTCQGEKNCGGWVELAP